MASAAVALCGCAPRDPYISAPAQTVTAGQWQIERQTDRVTGAPLSSATLITRTVAHTAVAFPPPASLQLMCFKEQPIVRLAFQFKIGSTRNAVLGYVFDDQPGREPEARFVDGYHAVVIEDQAEVARFARALAAAKVLYVRVRSLNAGRSSAEFRVDGASVAIAAAYAGCPLPPDQPAPAPKRTSALQ
jgi:hypothetical protein